MPRTDLKQTLFIDQYSTIAHSLGVRLLNFDCMMCVYYFLHVLCVKPRDKVFCIPG